MRWCADYADASNFDRDASALGGLHNPSGGGGLNWRNPDYEKLVAEAARELDPARRVDLYAQAEHILVNTDAVKVPLFWYIFPTQTKPYVTRSPPVSGFEHVEKWDIDLNARGQ